MSTFSTDVVIAGTLNVNPGYKLLTGLSEQVILGPAENVLKSVWTGVLSSGASPANYDSNTGLLTVQTAGLYAIGYSINIYQNTDWSKASNAYMKVGGIGSSNDLYYGHASLHLAQADRVSVTGSAVVQLNASQTIGVYVFSNYNTSINTASGAVPCYFYAHKIG